MEFINFTNNPRCIQLKTFPLPISLVYLVEGR
jgi:hypothetical protein